MINDISGMDAIRESFRQQPVLTGEQPLYQPTTQRERDNLEAARRIIETMEDPNFDANRRRGVTGTQKRRGNVESNRGQKRSLEDDIAQYTQQQYQQSTPVQQRVTATSSLRESLQQMPPLSDNRYGEFVGQNYGYEQQYTQTQPQYRQPMQTNSGIDYSALKYIINECIKENLGLIKQQLNESTVSGVRIGSGKKIYFSDLKGNIFEGQLKLVKKANE